MRLKQLRKLIELKPFVRAIEASNGLTGLIAENTKVVRTDKSESSMPCGSAVCVTLTMKGKPDIELVDLTSRIKHHKRGNHGSDDKADNLRRRYGRS